ncbi:hypothetical protein C7477_10348 [Phyllobacterium leguminum]|uniref:Uncharacterized protein n=1 Tax=Phyllobacterium leguminum TaxID=314237 RepID=A0A318T8A4_9HYPH|nr:hypothetical protein C7477_10348 [Phyllobacterium leguminum]
MTGMQLFAFVILPLVIAGLGWVIVLWTEYQNKRADPKHPRR